MCVQTEGDQCRHVPEGVSLSVHQGVWVQTEGDQCRHVPEGVSLSVHQGGEDRSRSVGCDEDITVKHILLDCVDF